MEVHNLPKNVPTASNQVLIHPEHAQGSLRIHKPSKINTKSLLNLMSFTAVLLLFATLAVSYFYLPRAKTVLYAKSTGEAVEQLNSKTKFVNDSLNSLYKALTGSNAGEDSDLNEIKADVLGANTSAATNTLVANSLLLTTIARETAVNQKRVKGFSIPEGDPNKAVRYQRKLAENVETKSKAVEVFLDSDLKEINGLAVSDKTQELQKELTSVLARTKLYTQESGKTSRYYMAISDAAIELYDISTTLNKPQDIDNAVADLSKLRNSFADYDEKELPSNIEQLNSDVVAVFDLLIKFFKEADTTDQNKLLNAFNSFFIETKNLSAQTYSHELTFWQNNKTLAAYSELSKDFERVIKQALGLRESNNYLLLNLLGIN